MHRTVLDATARAVFCSAWAAVQEEQGIALDGETIMDTAPATSPEAFAWSMSLWSQIVHVNHLGDLRKGIEKAWATAAKKDGADVDDEGCAREFGHMTAMEALGTGEKWSDVHKDPHLTIPVLAPESWDPMALVGNGEARENPGHAVELPPASEFRSMADRAARRAKNNGDIPIELSDRDINDFAEIVQAALRVWPSSVPLSQLWVRVFATPDEVELARIDESESDATVFVVCIELLDEAIHVRFHDHNEDDTRGERIVLADIGSMLVADVDSARDELAALGWTDIGGDYAEPPDGVLNVTEARENPRRTDIVVPSVDDLLDLSDKAIEPYRNHQVSLESGPYEYVHALTRDDCQNFAELVQASLEALGSNDTGGLRVFVTATDMRPLEVRREEASWPEGADPRTLDTHEPVVTALFGTIVDVDGNVISGHPNRFDVFVTTGDDGENTLDVADVTYYTNDASARDDLESLGWDVDTISNHAFKYQCRPPKWVWERAYQPRENPGEFPFGSFRAQSLVFDTAVFTKAQAKAWAKAHGFRHGSVDADENTWRIRQSDPSSFQQSAFRTLPMTDGVQAVIGVPK